MTEPTQLPPVEPEARQDGLAWVPLAVGGDVFLGLQELQKHLRDAYECAQRVELLIGGAK